MNKARLLAQALASLDARDFGKTETLCRRVLKADYGNLDASFLLGSSMVVRKRFAEAEPLMRKVLESHPNHIGALNNLGICLYEGRRDLLSGEKLFSRVLEVDPNNLNATTNLGNVYRDMNDLDRAERYLRRAVDLAPDNFITVNNLGGLYDACGDFNEAARCYRRALQLAPGHPDIQRNLLNAEFSRRDKRAVLDLARQILSKPNAEKELPSIFTIAKCWCLWDIEDRVRDKVIAMAVAGRADKQAFGMMNMYFLAASQVRHETLLAMHRLTAKLLDDERTAPPFDHSQRVGQTRRKLRIGYLSGDFRRHAVTAFIRGLVNHHDSDRFEVVCYSNVKNEDDTTAQYRAKADQFVRVVELPMHELAARIYADRIDILVDLAGYTSYSKIAVMTYRPAPVQMVYLGYPYTTGMDAVDYVVSDPYLDGPENARYFTERQLRLPESWITFDSFSEQEIDPQCPHERNGWVTFGTLNNIYKLNRDVISAWSNVLQQVEDSLLVINHPQCDLEETRQSILGEFRSHGVDEQRVRFVWEQHPGGTHLRYYNDIDIILDSFPLTGGTTTTEAIWMGVPVVTLVGDIFHERLSYSILSNVGLDLHDLIAFSREEYVAKAVALALNRERIRELHRRVPEALKTSILCDPVKLTRHMEAAYVEAWNRKFPDHPATLEIQEPIRFFPAPEEVQIAARDSLEDMDAYVLQECMGWFEQEYSFVLRFLRAGMRVLDIGSEIGIYAIPVAAKIAPEGRLWAVVFAPRDGRLLRMSVEHNRMGNLDILIGGDRKLRLDAEMAREGLHDIDFVRININVRDDAILQDSHEFFSANSPLVMFSVKRDNSVVDTALAAIFKGHGYGIYRLVPGLGALVPFAGDEELDAFAMNLFACKPDRAAALEEGGWLVRRMAPQAELPGTHVADWQSYLAGLPYAADLLPGWLSATDRRQDWEVYWVALNLFAQAKDAKREVARRCACLQTAGGILVMLAQSAPRLPRLLSLCRVLVELGRREAAVNVLNQLSALFEEGKGLDVDEPFLALTDESAALRPGDRLAEWLFASVLEQREKLRAFSTFFTGQESLPVLEAVRKTGFHSAETDRRIALIRQRYQRHAARQ